MKNMFDRGRSLVTAVAGAALLICIITGHAVAQSTNGAGDGALLERLARLDIHGVTLETTLSELWQRSGVPLAFSPDLVNGNGSVSCSCADITVREALDSLLAGTELGYAETTNRVLVTPGTGSVGYRQQSADQQAPRDPVPSVRYAPRWTTSRWRGLSCELPVGWRMCARIRGVGSRWCCDRACTTSPCERLDTAPPAWPTCGWGQPKEIH